MNKEKYFKSQQAIFEKDKNNKFYKNKEEIKSQDGVSVSELQFKQQVTNEVQKFINQSFDNIVVLVGAGASVTNNQLEQDSNGIATSGVTVKTIAKEVLKKLEGGRYSLSAGDVEVFKLDEIARDSHYSQEILDEKTLDKNFNLEDFLSNLFAYEKFATDSDKEKINNTKNAILDIIIKATSYDYDEKKFGHAKFLKAVSRLVKAENKLNIVTTNYDTLLEDAAESRKWTIFDGFLFSQTAQFDATMFDWNLIKDVPNVKTHENIYKKNVINLLKIHGSLTWVRSESGENIIRQNKELIQRQHKIPIMVFPSSDKYAQSYQEPYFELFSKFQELLKRPNTLLITAGFSFADNHIAQMVVSAIQANDGLATLITDYNIDSSNENWKTLENLMAEFYSIAFLKATMNGDLSLYLGGKIDDN